MIVVCPSCSARFQYDEARFQGARSKRFRCPKCAHVFEAENPSFAPAPTTVFNADAYTANQGRASETAPRNYPPIALPPPKYQTETLSSNPPISAGQDTAARNDLDSILASSGVRLPSGMRVSLAYLSGPQASTVKPLESSRTLIGREEGDVITKDPETSRRHATIDVHADGTVWLTDLGSTNGTFVDGVQIFGTIQLENRQEFTCGKSNFMLLVRKEDHLHLD